jgi:hypothetical protein
MMRALILFFALTSLGMTGNFCDNEPAEPAQGNYDRVGDLELVVSNPSADIPKGVLVIANPEMEQLRFYDTLDRSFVRAPNAYFPLSVRTGPSTSKLASVRADPTRIYALDSSIDEILVVRTVDEGDAPAFTPVGDGIVTGRAPYDIAVALAPDGILAFVTLPDAGAVQVIAIDPARGTGSERAYIDLGPSASPAGLAVDVIDDVVVVTDGTSSSVTLIRVDTLAIERRIDVGGPSFDVVMGRVDPGDGMAPVALVLRRDANEIAALRLYRPGYREDRAVLLARAEMPEPIETAYVPDQGRDSSLTGATTCCPGLDVAPEATRAWASVVSASGILYYVRFDGRRDESTLASGPKGLLRLVDNNPALPGFAGSAGVLSPNTAPGVWFPAPDDVNRPVITLTPVDNFGDPPLMPLFPLGLALDVEWEGVVPGARDRKATFVAGALEVTGDGRPLTSRDIQVGDHVVIDTRDRGALCPDDGILERDIASVSADRLTLDALTADDALCLGIGGEFTFTIHVARAFTARLTSTGHQGRVALDERDDETTPIAPEALLSIPLLNVSLRPADGGAPLRGSKLILELTQNLATVGISLSRTATTLEAGYGNDALLPTTFVGGEVAIQGIDELTPRTVRRTFLGLGSRRGLILEMNETETSIDSVIAP